MAVDGQKRFQFPEFQDESEPRVNRRGRRFLRIETLLHLPDRQVVSSVSCEHLFSDFDLNRFNPLGCPLVRRCRLIEIDAGDTGFIMC